MECRYKSPCDTCPGDCGVCLGHFAASPSEIDSVWAGVIVHENATVQYSNSIYIGQVKFSMAHGMGLCTYSSGNSYLGQWVKNQRHGFGTYKFNSGDTYAGDWRMSQRHGNGTFTWATGDVYTGEWRDDKRTGQGVYTWPSGDVYSGSFLASSLHGWGKFSFSDGDTFEGNIVEGNFNGYGEFKFSSGNVFKGNFKDDKLNVGTLYLAKDNETFHAVFSGGDEILNKFRVYGVKLYRFKPVTSETKEEVASNCSSNVDDGNGVSEVSGSECESKVDSASEPNKERIPEEEPYKEGRFSHGQYIEIE
jgi:hypothetical protein